MAFFEDIAYGKDHIIKFLHVATGTEVSFPAFVKQFGDNYTVNWSPTEIFGRTDPIQSYQNTRRTIDISFDVVSDSLENAKLNMEKYSTLKRMLYPMYGHPLRGGDFSSPGSKGRTLKAPPYIRIKFMNYIENVSDTSFEEKNHGIFSFACVETVSKTVNLEIKSIDCSTKATCCMPIRSPFNVMLPSLTSLL